MATTKKDPVLVVLQLTGANDYLNTIIPYTNSHYKDARPRLGIPEDNVLPIDDELAFNPNMGPVKDLYDQGKMAVVHGIGYENSPRSHFRSMDIWHTCEPDNIGDRGMGCQGNPGPGPGGRKRAERGQFRTRPAQGPGFARCARDLCVQPGKLRRA